MKAALGNTQSLDTARERLTRSGTIWRARMRTCSPQLGSGSRVEEKAGVQIYKLRLGKETDTLS